MSEDPGYVVIASGSPQGLHAAAQALLEAGFHATVAPPPDGNPNA